MNLLNIFKNFFKKEKSEIVLSYNNCELETFELEEIKKAVRYDIFNLTVSAIDNILSLNSLWGILDSKTINDKISSIYKDIDIFKEYYYNHLADIPIESTEIFDKVHHKMEAVAKYKSICISEFLNTNILMNMEPVENLCSTHIKYLNIRKKDIEILKLKDEIITIFRKYDF